MKAAFLIPCFDHGEPLRSVLESLAAYDRPVLVIDDGSAEPTRAALERAAAELDFVQIEHLPENRGKGAAVQHGFRVAARAGFSHVLLVDADGQHDVGAVPRFLEAMQKDPDALVLGRPIFDASAPRSRIWARQLSRAAVWLATLSFRIADPLCGMRGVPLALALRVMGESRLGPRMEFDPEFAVRCAFAGAPLVNMPVRVCYPPGGLSHFETRRDFPAMGATYVRLWLEMLARAPALLRAERAP